MCGRYTLHKTADEIAARYNLAQHLHGQTENYNVAPGQQMPVVVADESGAFYLKPMQWGLIPVWAKDPKIGYRLINARDDTIFDKPMWRSVILHKRCLVPADGFYEWQRQIVHGKVQKQPFYVHPKQIELFSFAGVWETWKDHAGAEYMTYSIITTEANKEMSGVHDRMPVILHPEDEAAWLDSSNSSRERLEPFLRPFEDGGLAVYEVGKDVNNTRRNDQLLLAPIQ